MKTLEPMKKIGEELVRACSKRYIQYLARHHGPLPPKVVELFHIQSYGGMCPKCGTFWKETSLNNRFASYSYYKPDCECYKPCPGIDRVFTYDGKPTVRRHTVKKTCGHPSFIEQELFGRMECDGCHVEIEAWKDLEPTPEIPRERAGESRRRDSTRRPF